MKRHQSRNISRNRSRVESLNPCLRYSFFAGVHPFFDIINKLSIKLQLEGRSREDAEKQAHHQLKMQADQKSSKARQNRKRNKV